MAEPYSKSTADYVLGRMVLLQEIAKMDEHDRKLAEEFMRQVRIAPTSIGPVDHNVHMDPIVVPEQNMFTDPESKLNRGLRNLGSSAVDAVLGEGTGSTTADILLGFTGPGAAIGTAATGNRPGVLDMLPGGGVIKGAVIALPKWAGVLAKSGRRIAADDAVELTRDIAHDVLAKLAKSETIPTKEILMASVRNEVDALGPFAGSLNVKEQAYNMVTRSVDDFLMGKNPTLQVKSGPVLEGLSKKTLEDVEDVAARQRESTRKSTANSRDRAKQYYEKLDDAGRAEIDADAARIAEEARAAAEASGDIGKYYNLKDLYSHKFREARLKIINGKIKADNKKSMVAADDLPDIDEETRAIVSSAGAEARKVAFDDAIKSGISQAEAIKIASLADTRARTAKLKELGGSAEEAKKARKAQMEANKKIAYEKLAPRYREMIDREANEAAELARKQALDLGATEAEANKKFRGRRQAVTMKRTNDILKSLGFSNASDPRLADMTVISGAE